MWEGMLRGIHRADCFRLLMSLSRRRSCRTAVAGVALVAAVAAAEGAMDEYLPAGSRGCLQPGARRGQGE